jgi:Gpi18-like mannosyltransferase
MLLLAVGISASANMGPFFLSSQAAPDRPAVDMWARWDSFWYLRIVEDGYAYSPTQQSPVAFFPLYPLAVRAVKIVTHDALIAGLLVSNGCFVLALAVLYRLALLETGSSAIARRAMIALCILPNTIFFSGIYSESLFLLCLLLCVYHLRTQHWGRAALSGALASATRAFGIGLVFFALLEWLRHYRQHPRDGWRAALLIGLMPAGLLLYMMYLAAAFGSPLAFLDAQAQWAHTLSNPLSVLVDTLRGILTGVQYWWFAPGEWLAAVVSLGLLPFIYRRFGLNYAMLAALLLLAPLFVTTCSFNRYAMVVFPLVLLVASWHFNHTLYRLYILTSTLLMALTTLLFVRGVFIA